MFKAHLSAFFAKVSPAVYHLRFCLSWNRDIFFLADHSQLTLARAQTSVSTLPSNTQSYPSAHLTVSPLPTTFLDTSTIPSSSFFLPLPLHLPASLRFYLLVWKCSLKTVVQFSWCRSPTVWSTFDSLQPSFSKKKKKRKKPSTFFLMTQEGWCFWQSSRGSDFIPWANFRMSFGVLSPSPSLTYISHVVFQKTVLVKEVSHSAHRGRVKASTSLLPIFSCR